MDAHLKKVEEAGTRIALSGVILFEVPVMSMNCRDSDDYNLAKVAKILKISRPLVLRLVKTGDLPSYRSRVGIRVNSHQLRAWVEGQMNTEGHLAKAAQSE